MTTRQLRKKAKLEAKGTYLRRGHWYSKLLERNVIDCARSLAHSISRHTGNPCDFREILRECGFEPKYSRIS